VDSRSANFGDVDLFYEKHYDNVLRRGLVGRAQDRTHLALEKYAHAGTRFPSVLEVGAGRGEHFSFVKHDFDTYVETDIRPRDQPASETDGREFEVADAQHLHFADASFDRVVATCLLLHLADPESALSEWRRVTRPGGQVDLLLPCDPGIVVRLARSLITAPAVKRSGFSGYGLFNARDHRNHVGGIDQLIRWVFRNDVLRITRYPFRLPSWNLNAYFIYSAVISS